MSHITWYVRLYDKDHQGLFYPDGMLPQQSWLIQWLEEKTVIFMEIYIYISGCPWTSTNPDSVIILSHFQNMDSKFDPFSILPNQ